MKFSRWALGAPLMAGSITVTHAGMLGTISPTYPIAEPDAIAQIVATLRAKERTGEIKRLQDAAANRSLHSAQHPTPVEGIRTATELGRRPSAASA